MLGGKPCCASMPLIAVLVGLGMFAVVGVRKWLKASARGAAKALAREGKRAHPLAVLLEHHDINDQVCKVLKLTLVRPGSARCILELNREDECWVQSCLWALARWTERCRPR